MLALKRVSRFTKSEQLDSENVTKRTRLIKQHALKCLACDSINLESLVLRQRTFLNSLFCQKVNDICTQQKNLYLAGPIVFLFL